MNAYFGCPARYAYSRTWRQVQVDRPLQDGIDAHALVAGLPAPEATVAAHIFRDRIREGLREHYHKLSRACEIKDEVRLTPSIILVRVLDRLGWDRHDQPAVIDYKTGTWPWKVYNGAVVPKARGFQPISYLIPPARKSAGFRPADWPRQVDFLTVPENGPTAVHRYHYDAVDLANLIDAACTVRDAVSFPKVRGIGCEFCPFRSKCYGYEKPGEYARRVGHGSPPPGTSD